MFTANTSREFAHLLNTALIAVRAGRRLPLFASHPTFAWRSEEELTTSAARKRPFGAVEARQHLGCLWRGNQRRRRLWARYTECVFRVEVVDIDLVDVGGFR